MILNDKKGVSPIIGAVLLVVITITVGATIFTFISNFGSDNLQTATDIDSENECITGVEYDVMIANNIEKICKDTTNNYLWAIMKNTGSKDIEFFRLTVLGSDGAVTASDTSSNISSNDINAINITYTTTGLGTPQEYQIEPVIKAKGKANKSIYCSNSIKKWTADNIATC
jgi:flagellin-like protein